MLQGNKEFDKALPSKKPKNRPLQPIEARMIRGMEHHPEFITHYRAGSMQSGMRFRRTNEVYQLGLLQKSASLGYTWEQANYAL